MSIVQKLTHLLQEPPPEFALEFSEAGIAWAQRGKTPTSGFQPLDSDVLSVSPVRDNVLKPEALDAAVTAIVAQAASSSQRRRRACALILPDYCGRVAVLDFDSFPSESAEQMSLVRFRVKKSVPFDLDAASVSFHVQPHAAGGKKKDVVVAVVSLEILARYEAPLRMSGLHPGQVTISALTALNMVRSTTLEVTAKLSGRALSVAVTENNVLRMFRCVEMAAVSAEEITTVLFPTFAYVEDELKRRPERLLLCGFGSFGETIAPALELELHTPIEPLRSPLGIAGPHNAGLMGYLQGVGIEVGVAA
ncbi:MAG TPA: hypothetical protein VM120_11680 [Bryobacteraceae bacterium]|nr:hypothetical protein [Bryobacteraceae bacterium]